MIRTATATAADGQDAPDGDSGVVLTLRLRNSETVELMSARNHGTLRLEDASSSSFMPAATSRSIASAAATPRPASASGGGASSLQTMLDAAQAAELSGLAALRRAYQLNRARDRACSTVFAPPAQSPLFTDERSRFDTSLDAKLQVAAAPGA